MPDQPSAGRPPGTGRLAGTGGLGGTDPTGTGTPGTGSAAMDTTTRYRLHPDVALRPERFGALAYHYGSRRLTFLRSPLLADLVRRLGAHPSVDAALAEMVPEGERPAYRRALCSLAESDFIGPSPDPAAISGS